MFNSAAISSTPLSPWILSKDKTGFCLSKKLPSGSSSLTNKVVWCVRCRILEKGRFTE
ncbi:unnamed protein product [Callosobruchus maculatus]|uniref:Uncharacterized protein n=1 Tax=Callosobruchus maculatus TaxID=64391 RepID=A0A653BZF7_CALMS|nr:unnamed protein product [Callosobruchus maculatus]